MNEDQRALLKKIKTKFPKEWFNAKNVNGKMKDLETLEKAGLLRSSKPVHSGPINWRLVEW
jgi:hypothetical protein